MSTICADCGHRHRQAPQCLHCGCFAGVPEKEKTMFKKIWKIICWPFKKFLNWLASCLPASK